MDDHLRDIEGYPGHRVSRDGEDFSCWGRGVSEPCGSRWTRLKPIARGRGYVGVNLHRDGRKTSRYVHHLVLEAFVGPRPPGLICCHGDGDPSNSRVANLRWDTYQSNSDDMLRHGTRLVGSRANAKLTEGDVAAIRRRRAEGATMSGLASDYEVSKQNIQAIVHRRSWRHL